MSVSPGSGGPQGLKPGGAIRAARRGRYLVSGVIGFYVVALVGAWCVARGMEKGAHALAPAPAQPLNELAAPVDTHIPVQPQATVLERAPVDLVPPHPDEVQAPWQAGHVNPGDASR